MTTAPAATGSSQLRSAGGIVEIDPATSIAGRSDLLGKPRRHAFSHPVLFLGQAFDFRHCLHEGALRPWAHEAAQRKAVEAK